MHTWGMTTRASKRWWVLRAVLVGVGLTILCSWLPCLFSYAVFPDSAMLGDGTMQVPYIGRAAGVLSSRTVASLSMEEIESIADGFMSELWQHWGADGRGVESLWQSPQYEAFRMRVFRSDHIIFRYRNEATEGARHVEVQTPELEAALGPDDIGKDIKSMVVQDEAGWPMRAFYCEYVLSPIAIAPPNYMKVLHHGFMIEGLNESWMGKRVWGIWDPWTQLRVLPYGPRWMGLLIDTTFWGGAYLASAWLLSSVRRMWRRRCGLCPDCGYSIHGSAGVCPECGGCTTGASAPRYWRIKSSAECLLRES